jgi:hypothetical protein
MRGRSKPDECNVWTVLTRHSIVVGKEFIFRAGPAPIALLALLYASTSLEGAFTIPAELAEIFGWRFSRFAAARRVLVRAGYLEVVRIGSRKRPAVYCWARYPETPALAGSGRRRKPGKRRARRASVAATRRPGRDNARDKPTAAVPVPARARRPLTVWRIKPATNPPMAIRTDAVMGEA